MISTFGFGIRLDPGPCPICGTPHTACTPESVAAQQARASVEPATTSTGSGTCSTATPPEDSTFSTSTYSGQMKRRRTGGR
jgi:hypothetical protein